MSSLFSGPHRLIVTILLASLGAVLVLALMLLRENRERVQTVLSRWTPRLRTAWGPYRPRHLIAPVSIVLLALALLVLRRAGWARYTIQEVSQAFYDEDLVFSVQLSLEYWGDNPSCLTRDDVFTLPDHGVHVSFYPTRTDLRRITRSATRYARGDPLQETVFVKGNVFVRVFPELAEADAARFRRALESLR